MFSNQRYYRIHRFLIFGLLLCGLLPVYGLADTDPIDKLQPARLELIDQSVLFGRVINIRGGKLTLATELIGEVEIDLTAINRLESNGTVELLMFDKTVVETDSLQVANGEVMLDGLENFNLKEIYIANPENWEKGVGYQVTGRVTSALHVNRGNTQIDKFDIYAESILESRQDRVTIRANYEEAHSLVRANINDTQSAETVPNEQTQTTVDNWHLIGKYDYFFKNPRNYLGVNLSYSVDEFADIGARAYLGPYFGRKLFTLDWLKLDAELGLSYVDTDFLIAKDNSYAGLNLNLTGESNFFDGAFKLYLRQISIVNLTEFGESLYKTTIGLSFPLLTGLEAAAEISADYDGGAADRKDKLDQTYRFRVGYTW